MKAIELTKNEREVLEAIVANAKKVGDSGVEFILQDVARETGKSIRSISATTVSLAKKGMLLTANGDSYFDGELTEAGLHEVESSKVNNNQEVKLQSNKSKNMATKNSKTVKVEDSKSVTNAVDNFDAPVMDERILKLNELKAVKMANLSKGKRPAAKEAKELATYILNNWDNLAELKNIKSEDVTNEDLQNILASRLKNFEDASKAAEKAVKEAEKAEKAPKAKTEKKETKKAAPAKAKKADSKKAEPKAKEEKKDEPKVAKTARKVGDIHPKHPTWVWTEYAEGKFDWRTNPADKKQGQRTDKAATSEKKSEPKKADVSKKAVAKETNKKVAKGGKVEKEAPKELTIDEFVALPTKSARGNKKPSEAQKESLKLIMKGYRVTADHKFFENAEGDKKACNWDSVVAMLKRYGMEYIPVGLVK
jgi:type 1 fimbria pilin